MKNCILTILACVICFPVVAGLTAKKNKNGWYGFVNESGEFVVPAKYERVGNLSDSILWVFKSKKYGLLNSEGTIITEPKYTSIDTFKVFGLCKVSLGGKYFTGSNVLQDAKYGFINKQGAETIAPAYDFMGNFDENGVCWVNSGGVYNRSYNNVTGGKFGYINTAGNLLTPIEYDQVSKVFYNGYSWVKKDNKFGYINTQGGLITEIKYDFVASEFVNDMALVMENNKYGYISITGDYIIPSKYNKIGIFKDGYTYVAVTANDDKTLKYGYINIDGKEIIEPVYDNAHPEFFHNRAAVEKNGKWAVVDINGNLLTDFEYSEISPFTDGIARVSKGGKTFQNIPIGAPWGLMDTTANLITPVKYTLIKEFNEEGLAMVTIDPFSPDIADNYNKVSRMNISTPLSKRKEVHQSVLDMQKTITEEEKVIGWINKQGEEIIPLMYKKAKDFKEELALVSVDEKMKFINSKNEIVIDTDYSAATAFSNGIAYVRDSQSKLWGCIDKKGNVVVPLMGTDINDAENMVKALYLPDKKTVTNYQAKIYLLKKNRPQDKFKLTDIIPDNMWDY